jgi:hypothetical protein
MKTRVPNQIMIALYKRMGKLIPGNTSIAIGIILAIMPATAQQQKKQTHTIRK